MAFFCWSKVVSEDKTNKQTNKNQKLAVINQVLTSGPIAAEVLPWLPGLVAAEIVDRVCGHLWSCHSSFIHLLSHLCCVAMPRTPLN